MRRRRWLWFFVTLAGLSALALTTLIVYNLRQQLRPEQLAEARERWQQHRPDDYDLDYTLRQDDAGPETCHVRVRSGERGGRLFEWLPRLHRRGMHVRSRRTDPQGQPL